MSKSSEGAGDLTSKDKSKSAIAAGSVEFASNDSVEAAATNRSAEPEVIPVDPDGTEELPAATIEDGSEGEVQGRSGAMLKRRQVDEDVEGDRKNSNAKPIRPEEHKERKECGPPVRARWATGHTNKKSES